MTHIVVAEALDWCGTPFHPGASVKGAGCDCYGLVVGVHAAVCGRAVAALPCAYQPTRTVLRRIQKQMITHLETIAMPVPLVDTAPGDVLLFAPDTRTIVHCGILTAPDQFVHALNDGAAGRVCVTRFLARWRQWHVLTYRLTGLESPDGQYSSDCCRFSAGSRCGAECHRSHGAGESGRICRGSD